MALRSENLTYLDIEISTTCQAGCLDCVRTHHDSKTNKYYSAESWHPYFNKLYPLDAFEKHIKQFATDREVVTIFCGNSGDPFSHPQLTQMADVIKRNFPNGYLEIETNGGLGKLSTFETLAEQKVAVKFSIDGLEDTNHIYRRNVKWESVMRNAKHFISKGGYAIWDTIDFPWTVHQRDQIRQTAHDMGFYRFEVSPRSNPDLDDQLYAFKDTKVMPAPDGFTPDQNRWTVQNKWFTNNIIEPQCKTKKGDAFFLACDGTVWPCCLTEQIRYRKDEPDHQHWLQLEAKYGNNWNSLYHQSLQGIIDVNWYKQDLESSWKNAKLMKSCVQKCGKCLTS